MVRKHKFKGIKATDKITISLGIASYPDKRIKTQEDLINIADNALMKAKSTGRNKFVLDHA